MRVGFVGLGDQGEPMAQRILEAGHELAVFVRRAEQVEPWTSRGAVVTRSLPELAESSQLLGVCVGTDAQVQDVGEIVVPALQPDSILAVHSTVQPRTCVELSCLAAGRDISVIDAPVSGGRARAFRGELTVMVGGEEDAVARARPIFETFGTFVAHVGGVGAGQTLKLLNNFIFAAQVSLTADAIAMCRALDLDIAQSISAVAASTGSSRALQMFVESGYVHAFPRHSAGYTHGAALLGKDVDLMDSLLASGAIPPVLNLVARTGLRVAGEAAAVESARFDRPAGRTE